MPSGFHGWLLYSINVAIDSIHPFKQIYMWLQPKISIHPIGSDSHTLFPPEFHTLFTKSIKNIPLNLSLAPSWLKNHSNLKIPLLLMVQKYFLSLSHLSIYLQNWENERSNIKEIHNPLRNSLDLFFIQLPNKIKISQLNMNFNDKQWIIFKSRHVPCNLWQIH